MRFESSIYLWLLSIIPLLAVLMSWSEWHRNKMLKRLGEKKLVKQLMKDSSVKRRWIKFSLLSIALVAIIIMLARPQMGTKVSHEKRNGIEAIICLDISNSMLAEDVMPSRLQKSKMLIENMVEHFSNDKLGLIVFAGDAFVQLPITSDYVSAKMFLQNIEPSLIQTQGTDIAAAINLAANSFTQQKNIGKAIIVITDGEDHEGGAKEAAQAARDKGYKVFILGIGDTSGAPIPLGGGEYMRDNSGYTVMTKLNEQMCKDIAVAGSGTYIHVDNTSAAQESLNDEIAKMQKGDMESVVYSEYNEQYQVFGLIAILIIIIEVLISEVKNPWFNRFKIFKDNNTGKVAIFVLALCLFANQDINAQRDRTYIRQGNKQMRRGAEGAPAKAEIDYRKALVANSSNSQAMYNLGCALMAQQRDSAAMEMFQKAAGAEKSKVRKAMSYHNMGVILQRNQQYGGAIEQYKQALRLTPNDAQTRYNLVLCQRMQRNNPNNNNNSGGGDNDKDKNKDKNKDQNDKNKDKQKENNSENKDKQEQNKQMSKENADQLLNAAMQEEKQTQQRLKKAMSQPRRKTLQKNW